MIGVAFVTHRIVTTDNTDECMNCLRIRFLALSLCLYC